MSPESQKIWFVYDGECPICQIGARRFKIRDIFGELILINAREQVSHPILLDITAKGFDLDKGMVIQFNEKYYHGADALHIMAFLGAEHGWFNHMNRWIFRSKRLTQFAYPIMKAVRNMMIKIKGVPSIQNLGKH